MDLWFISDIHLKSLNERNGIILLRFLRSLADGKIKATHLFLLGDIFDVWFGGHQHFVQKWHPIVNLLEEIQFRGIKVIYFEGNHDMHIASFWQKHLGVEVYTEAKTFDIDGRKILVEHGDLINLNDQAYLRYRKSVRHPISKFLAENLPGAVWSFVGDVFSHESRKYSAKDREEHARELRQMMHEHALKAFAQERYDLHVTGHMHIRDEFVFQKNGKDIYSINLGSWFDAAKALHYGGQNFNWVELK